MWIKKIIELVLGGFFKPANAVINTSVLVLLTPAFLWALGHQNDEVLIFQLQPFFRTAYTLGQLAFFGIVAAGIIKLAQCMKQPTYMERPYPQQGPGE